MVEGNKEHLVIGLESENAFNELIHALEMFSRIRKALMKLPGKNLHNLTYANQQYCFFRSKICPNSLLPKTYKS